MSKQFVLLYIHTQCEFYKHAVIWEYLDFETSSISE